ncbi:hypothetical protein FDUTEX481_06102 [Tolypothrix sp. PCC 7601]|nr:hypothetical protein FDUTEX481_06102 [Tolypothrix sp. PCC 7601]
MKFQSMNSSTYLVAPSSNNCLCNINRTISTSTYRITTALAVLFLNIFAKIPRDSSNDYSPCD